MCDHGYLPMCPSLPETQPPGAIVREETGIPEQPIVFWWSTLAPSGEPGAMVVREGDEWLMCSGPDDDSPTEADDLDEALAWLWRQGPPYYDVFHLVAALEAIPA
jgi:hypothetical protein